MSSTSSGTDAPPRRELHDTLAAELYAALRERRTVAPLRDRGLDLEMDDAYAISLGILARRLRDGERVVGKKIGVTSKPVQDMLGVHQPDFGFLTDRMWIADGGTVRIAESMIQPRAEAEIALILRSSLKGPGITPQDVLEATAEIAPCFEIVDSRIANWNIRIIDTVADNASCGVFVLGSAQGRPACARPGRAQGAAYARTGSRCPRVSARPCRARRSRPSRGLRTRSAVTA